MLRKLEKYEILEELGHGGMATVYRAEDTRLERAVAVKIMHPHLRAAKEARTRFTREARTVARLKHPNILEIYDYSGEDSDESYIATELLSGPTLKAFSDEHPHIPAEIAACFTAEIARALGAAHAAGIIHRDVKPENVMLHEGKGVKLTDFGIAQMVDAASMTATGQILGSPGHMAPEQIEGKECDARSDIFSLGTVLYLLATGRLPFTGKNPHHILKRIVDGDFSDPLRLRPSIGGPLRAILLKCLAREPADRYASAAELEADLVRFVADAGIEDPAATLRAYLRDPDGFTETFHRGLIDTLVTRGEKTAARGDIAAAQEALGRALALDESNARALAALEGIGRGARRKRALSVGLVSAAIISVLGLGYVWLASVQPPSPAPQVEGASSPSARAPGSSVSASPAKVAAPAAASTTPTPIDTTPPSAPIEARPPVREPVNARAQPISTTPRTVVFNPSPPNVRIGVDGAEPRPFGPSFRQVELAPGRHRFVFIGALDCCVDETFETVIPPGPGSTTIARSLGFRPASVYVTSNVPADVIVNDGVARGRAREVLSVPMRELEDSIRIQVTAPEHRAYTERVRVQAGRVTEVRAILVRNAGASSGVTP